MTHFSKKLNVAVSEMVIHAIDRHSVEFMNIRNSISLMESTKIRVQGVIGEANFRDILAAMLTVAQRKQAQGGQAVVVPDDLFEVCANLLQHEADPATGQPYGDDTGVVAQKAQELVQDKGVLQSLNQELRKHGVVFQMPSSARGL